MLDSMYITNGEPHRSDNRDKMAGLVSPQNPSVLTQILNHTLRQRPPTLQQPDESEVDGAGSMDYRFEQSRLDSYENWPSPFIRPADLAAAGFYFTKQIDRVRCFECRTEICRWEEGDDPMTEHQRWGGRCRFIRKLPCGNVPIGADPSTIPLPRPRSRDVCGNYNLDYRMDAEADTHHASSSIGASSAAGLGRLGISVARRPDFPDYASYEARLQTFNDWPLSMAQTKEQMADAGFFYTGTGDQTTCYHCGGGLKNWETQDDPWVQHAKWFSTCFYLRLVKGQEFINSVTGKDQPPPSEEEMTKMKLPSCITKVESPKPESREESSSQPTPSDNATASTESSTPRTSTEVESEAKASTATSKSNDATTPEETRQNEKKGIDDARVCKICYNEELGVVFMPCGHIVACVKCAPSMTTCAVCRKEVHYHVRAFFS